MPRRRLRRVRHHSRRHSSSFSSIRSGWRISASIALICRARQSRTSSSSKQGCSGAKRRSTSAAAAISLGLRSEPLLIVRATDCKGTVQLWHGPPPFCGAEPFLPNRKAGQVRSHRGWLVSCDGYDGPPKNGGGHGPERTRRIPKRYSHNANGTASRPQGSPFRATCAFSEEREKLRQEALEERERYRRERSVKDSSRQER